MISIKNQEQISNVHIAGNIIKHILATIPDILKEDITTAEIDAYVHQSIVREGGAPSFLGYKNYPASCCVSVNEEIIHGIPSSKKKIKNGDVVSVDIGVMYQKGFADSAYTFYVDSTSNCPAEIQRLLTQTYAALTAGIATVKPNSRISDIAKAVYSIAQKEKFGVVREYCGHGVGNAVHEEPEIPNYYPFFGANTRLQKGMILAIEPMFSLGKDAISHGPDNFTVLTADRSIAAHFEHTVVVTDSGYKILT